MSELKPCPFCGGEAEMFSRRCAEDAMEAWIQCSSCFSVTGSTQQYEDAFAPREQAIAAWNQRAQPSGDRIANYLNSLDTEGLTPEQVRSVIYAECMERGAGTAKESHYRGVRPQPSDDIVERVARAIRDVKGGEGYSYEDFCRDAAQAALRAMGG